MWKDDNVAFETSEKDLLPLTLVLRAACGNVLLFPRNGGKHSIPPLLHRPYGLNLFPCEKYYIVTAIISYQTILDCFHCSGSKKPQKK
jgi:hypothetical protein